MYSFQPLHSILKQRPNGLHAFVIYSILLKQDKATISHLVFDAFPQEWGAMASSEGMSEEVLSGRRLRSPRAASQIEAPKIPAASSPPVGPVGLLE